MQLYFLLTEKCNLNCRMCIRGEKSTNEVHFEDLELIKNIDEFRDLDIVITGGEPTLCRDFEIIVSTLAEIAKTVSICSNGIHNFYIDKSFFKPNMTVQISIDGTEAIHDQIRGKNAFTKSMDTVQKLDSLSIPYIISTVVSKKNVSNIPELIRHLSPLKNLQYWAISYEMPFGYASFKNMMDVTEWNRFVDHMLNIVEFRMKIQKLFPFDLFIKYKDQLESIVSERFCSNCGSGRNKIYVYPDLNVYPCTCLTDFRLGNLKEHSLSDILKNEKTKSFSNYTVSTNSICSNCEFLKYCNGGCIGMSYHYFNEIGHGDIRCPKINNLR